MASKGDQRPFRAEMQLMQRRAGSQTQPVSVPSSVDLDAVREEIAGSLNSFREQLLGDMRAMLSGLPVPGAAAAAAVTVALGADDEVDALKTDLKELAGSIKETKVELGQLMHSSEDNPRMDVVRSELCAVVAGQETATGSILECMEAIEEAAQQIRDKSQDDGTVEEPTNDILDNVVKVFEHCNFQDLSGQRITKVINTLNFIDARIQKISRIWGEEEIRQYASDREILGPDDLERTLAKPTEESEKISQDEIDKLFS